ncbi:MAG: DUF934 domain-containing protein [Proteobacteria bacterium]|nr:DUF934 domain-containing protein [Pseudomonadota bacterium]
MRHILRRREWRADDFRYAGESGAADSGLIVPFAEWRSAPGQWQDFPHPLGVRLALTDHPEELAQYLPRLSLVAVEFPSAGEGRGYTQGRLVRERYGFTGELRAVGAGVKQDLLFLLARCGFDSFELAPGESVEAARAALTRYDVAYQPGDERVSLRAQRFPSAA